ncbi:peptidylprolyl isomerase [Haliea atlantica]
MLKRQLWLALGLCVSVFVQAGEEIVIRDGDVTVTRAEFEEIVERWSRDMREAAANDTGDRLELINIAVTNKKLAQAADTLTPEADGEDYWTLYFREQNLKRRFMIDRFVANVEVPELSDLARERYATEKDKYAKVPEKRLTSHILWVCPPGQCEREPVREEAREVLAQLRDGADFEAMVEKYSGDPGSRKKGGRFEKWFSLGEKGVEPRYTGGAFDIEEVGAYSDLVETQFGVHIIRLDDVQKAHYKSFEEVRDLIIRTLRGEYVKAAVKDYESSLSLSDEVRIDGAAMEDIFAPYKSAP